MRAVRACGRSRARSGSGTRTVAEYLRRTAVIGITWPVPPDSELERRLFAPAGFNRPPARIMPEWNHVYAEHRRRAVTLLLLGRNTGPSIRMATAIAVLRALHPVAP